MRTLAFAVLAGGILAPGCGAAPDSSETAGAPIIGGQLSSSADDAVVRLVIGDANDEVCSGTLIAPNAVLSARHCVAKRKRDEPRVACRVEGAGGLAVETTPDYPYAGNVDPRSITVTVGADLDLPHLEARGRELVTDDAGTICGHDIAVLILDRSIEDVAPRKVRLEAPRPAERLTAVGWGFTDQTSSTGSLVLPTKRVSRAGVEVLGSERSVIEYRRQNGTIILAGAADGELSVGEAVCNGDSGGPLFDPNGEIVGVTSRRASMVSIRCVDSPAIFSAPGSSRHRPTIDAALARAQELATSSPRVRR